MIKKLAFIILILSGTYIATVMVYCAINLLSVYISSEKPDFLILSILAVIISLFFAAVTTLLLIKE